MPVHLQLGRIDLGVTPYGQGRSEELTKHTWLAMPPVQ